MVGVATWDPSPNEGTDLEQGLSVEQSASRYARGGGQARCDLPGERGAQRLGVAPGQPQHRGRQHSRTGNLRTSYWELCRRQACLVHAMPTPRGRLPRRRGRRVAGTPAARLDLPDKVFGRPRFIHQLALPGMLHGRVLKPASPGPS
jgi:hypothetical protein